jgi:hypothetical protein
MKAQPRLLPLRPERTGIACSLIRKVLAAIFPIAGVFAFLFQTQVTHGQSMPGETDPVASGFYLSGNAWFKDNKRVTPSGVSEFRVIGGKPFWKSGSRYFYNSMTSFTSTDWGNAGACTAAGATCFFVLVQKETLQLCWRTPEV